MKSKIVVIPGIIAKVFEEKPFLVLSWVSNHIGILNTVTNTL